MFLRANIEKAGITGTGLYGMHGLTALGTLMDTAQPEVSPAALLKPMPSILPQKPGSVSSSQVGIACRLSSWASQNPIGAVLLALGVGWLVKGMKG